MRNKAHEVKISLDGLKSRMEVTERASEVSIGSDQPERENAGKWGLGPCAQDEG